MGFDYDGDRFDVIVIHQWRDGLRKQCRQVVVIAVARELAGFLWAEMTA